MRASALAVYSTLNFYVGFNVAEVDVGAVSLLFYRESSSVRNSVVTSMLELLFVVEVAVAVVVDLGSALPPLLYLCATMSSERARGSMRNSSYLRCRCCCCR